MHSDLWLYDAAYAPHLPVQGCSHYVIYSMVATYFVDSCTRSGMVLRAVGDKAGARMRAEDYSRPHFLSGVF